MTAYRINDAELHALAGEAADVVQLYLVALRPRMDFKTGVIGRRVRISYQALREWTERWGRPGVRYHAHDKSKLQRLLARLEDIGLLRRVSTNWDLVFACPLADADHCVQKKPDTKSIQPAAPQKPKKHKALRPTRSAARTPKPDTHPESGNTLTPPPTSAPQTPVLAESSEVPISQPLIAPAPIQAGGDCSQELAEGGSESASLAGIIWPAGLTRAQQQYLKRSTAALSPTLIQRLLDEWQGAQRAGIVRQPWPYYQQLLRSAATQGEAWTTVYADAVAAQRVRDQQRVAYLARKEAAFLECIGGQPGPLPRGALVQLQKQLAAGRPQPTRV